MGRRHPAAGGDHRAQHLEVLDQHGVVLDRRPRRDQHNGIARLQKGRKDFLGTLGAEIDLGSTQWQNWRAHMLQPVRERRSDKSPRAEDYRAFRRGWSGMAMFNHRLFLSCSNSARDLASWTKFHGMRF